MGLIQKVADYFRPKQPRKVETPQQDFRPQNAYYDAWRTTDENKNYWAHTDHFDADSANQKLVRHEMMWRSRYELNSNGYADGIAQTLATDLVGVGPGLRMQTASTNFNQMVETAWNLWTKEIHFRRKLWCMAHAKYGDGEAFAVLRKNSALNFPVALDVVLYEADQVQTPYGLFVEPNRIDGIKFDDFGNPIYYDLMHHHPGNTHQIEYNPVPEQIPADRMLHWFKMRRPGQHRGIPEMASTLNLGAAARRYREATLAAAESAADINIVLKTGFQPDVMANAVPFSTMPLEKRMMTALPAGYDASQMRSEFPTTTYWEYHKSLINEQGRPASMPLNKAMCNSADYNFASGRLDALPYCGNLDVQREDCNDLVLNKVFSIWFDLSITAFSWLGGDPLAVSSAARAHDWDWPKHRIADVESEANANKTRLATGQIGLERLYSEMGLDLEDEIPQMAKTYGVTDQELRLRLFDVVLALPKSNQPVVGELPLQPPAAAPAKPAPPAKKMAALDRETLLSSLNGNGHAH